MIKLNKIGKKLLLMVSVIILIVFGVSFLLNNYFSADYYLYKMKNKVNTVYEELNDLTIQQLTKTQENIENEHNVTIVIVENAGSIAEINENMQFALYKDKIVLNKFWITEEALKKVDEGQAVRLLFNQGKLKTSLLTVLYEKDQHLVLVGTVVAHNTDALTIVNQLYLYSLLLGIIISTLLVALFSKKMITPLEQLKNVAKDITNLNFQQVEITSGDEIEELSHSINEMSNSLKNVHSQLEKKNRSLNTLISSISHEVKTPLSLIQAYTIGIKDGLDDDSYTDIILEQVSYTSEMVDYLIKLSKIHELEVKKESFELKSLIQKIMKQYNISLKNNNVQVVQNFDLIQNSFIYEDSNQIEIVMNNLISNAIKYGEDQFFEINLTNENKNKIKFSIRNKTTSLQQEQLPFIWDAFYVAEESRNKEISGTGLGLSIVASILAKNDLQYEVVLVDSYIRFTIWFDLVEST